MTCDYASCAREAVSSDQGYSFCRPHYYEHLSLLREQASKDCLHCQEPFVSTDPRRKFCNDCRRFRKDTRPSYAKRAK